MQGVREKGKIIWPESSGGTKFCKKKKSIDREEKAQRKVCEGETERKIEREDL